MTPSSALTVETLKETLREMYEQPFYRAGDKDYEVWLDRVAAYLLPRLGSPVAAEPTEAMRYLDQLNRAHGEAHYGRDCGCGALAQDGRFCNFHTAWFALRAALAAARGEGVFVGAAARGEPTA